MKSAKVWQCCIEEESKREKNEADDTTKCVNDSKPVIQFFQTNVILATCKKIFNINS
jgi:hypothetical protein